MSKVPPARQERALARVMELTGLEVRDLRDGRGELLDLIALAEARSAASQPRRPPMAEAVDKVDEKSSWR
jgi:hypothetical protein